MRTKVEKKQKKVSDEELRLNMPSAKVVLDASDCARLLDGVGQTSVIVVEKDGKMVAASSVETLSAPFTNLAVSCVGPSLKASAGSVSPQTVGTITVAAPSTQSTICSGSSGSGCAGDNTEMTQKPVAIVTSDEDNTASSRKGVLDQCKAILKPPKKRRGIEVEFEGEALSQPLLKNGDLIHSTLTPSVESGCWNAGSSQKHSVERLLQHSSTPSIKSHTSVITNNNSANFNISHHLLPQSHSIFPAEMELATSKAETSVPSSTASSTTPLKSQPSHQSLFLQSKSDLYTKPTQNDGLVVTSDVVQENAFVSSAKSKGDSTLYSTQPTLSDKVSKKRLPLSPEQEEPINLTTSKSVITPITSQMCTKTPVEGCEPVSNSHSTTSTLSENSTADGQGTQLDNSISPYRSNPENNPALLAKASTVNSLHVSKLANLQQNGLAADMRAHQNHSSGICFSTDSPHSHPLESPHTQALITDTDNHSHSHPKNNRVVSDHTETSHFGCHVTSSCTPQESENVEEKDFPTGANSCKLGKDSDSSDHKIERTNDCELNKNESLSKSKKPPKKRLEVAMDEASCAHRLAQYALTIDDVIANFVYVPEPVEEICLTEEEELALRDQFEAEEQFNDKTTETTKSNIEEVVCLQPNSNNSVASSSNSVSSGPAVQSAETQTTIFPSASLSVGQHNQLSSVVCLEAKETSSNIDSVLAYVAADVTQPGADQVSTKSNVKKIKKKNILKEARSEGLNACPPSKDKKKKKKKSKDLNQETCKDGSSLTQLSENLPVLKSGLDPEKDLETKPIKQKKAKKRKASDNISNHELSLPSKESSIVEEQNAVTPKKKKKKILKNLKISKEVCTASQIPRASPSHTPADLTMALLDVNKDLLSSNKTSETSDIGESIASTSGGSEQDTPLHENDLLSSKSCKTTKANVVKDKDSQDTGLESSCGEDVLNKPVRRYKKRLDFVKCERCEHQARGRSALSRHMKKVHEVEVDMPHKCPHCSYGCSKQASLNRHLFTHGVFSCSRCSFVGVTRISLTQHVLETHRDKLDLKLCKVCNRYIKCDQVTIEEHTSACQGPTPYKCSVCDKEFKYGSSLRVHYHTHFPDQPKKFKCELCEYRTNYKANLHKHHKNMHAVKGKEIQCPDCGKFFSTEDNMRRHRKVHTLARPFACETCKKTFKTSGALKGHQLIHTATRPYTCNITGCNRSFRTPKFLKSHQEEFHRLVPKKFFCSVEGCNYSFFKRSHLKRHAITHTGERNFHCTWPGCHKSFRHSDNLKVHFRSHTMEKTLQCHLCDFKTKQKNSMFWHKKKVHQIVETSKSAEGNTSKISELKTDEEVASGQGKAEPSFTPSVAESSCQTALVMSEQSEDGSLIDTSERTAQFSDKAPKAEKGGDEDLASSKSESEKHKTVRLHAPNADTRGLKDLYEFKSDDDSEEETPGTFRRDLIPKDELAPLPPPPKELLMKNELEEQKEQAKKEREQKKELEKKEKAEKREQVKKEKAERRELEKKEKIEKKELEKKEKIEKKALEKKEKIEKKELEKKEKEEKKEIEKKEKIEKKELEMKEKIEKRELEKKERAEKKEQEKREKMEKKEMEMKEKAEKREKEKLEKEKAMLEKEKARKEKEDQRKAKEQLKLEREKEKEQKRQEKERLEKEKAEEKQNIEEQKSETEGKKLKAYKRKVPKKSLKGSLQTSDTTSLSSSGIAVTKKSPSSKKGLAKKLPARGVRKRSHIVLRNKSPRRLAAKEDAEAKLEKPKRGRRKKVVEETQLSVDGMGMRKKRGTKEIEQESSPVKRKRVSKKSAEETAVSPRSPRSPRAVSPRAAPQKTGVPRKAIARLAKKASVSSAKKKPAVVHRKMSARIKAKTVTPSPTQSKVLVRGRKGAKPGPKKKSLLKMEQKVEENAEKMEHVLEETSAAQNGEEVTRSKTTVRKDMSKKPVESKKMSTRRGAAAINLGTKSDKADNLEESLALPTRPESPAYSEELMLQGNASPYRDFSDADNSDKEEENEDMESKEKRAQNNRLLSPASNNEITSHDVNSDQPHNESSNEKQEENMDQEETGQASNSPKRTESSGKSEEPDAGHNEDAYFSDDDVSNDIPLTPPRAPAPPPVESSEDEMEEPAEPESSAPVSVPGPTTPVSVPGPNTPFSVPGPQTPFSVPPPTNLMQQQHSVPSEDTPLSTVPSVQSTELHSQGSVDLQHPMGSVELHHSHSSAEMHQGSVEMYQPQGSVEMHQAQGSVEMHHSQGSVELHSHNSSVEIKNQGSVDMQQMSNSSGELHIPSSGDVHPQRLSDMNHAQGTAQMHHDGVSLTMQPHTSVDIYPHSSVELRQRDSFDAQSEASTIQKLRDEAMSSVKSPQGIVMREGSDTSSVSDKYQLPPHLESFGKYGFPHPLPDQSHSEADKAYFDQYLKSLSSSRGGLSSGMSSSPTGLQQLEAMVGKSHIDGAPKSPANSLPASVISSLDSTLGGENRTRMDTLVPPEARPHHHDTLYSGRETPSTLSRLPEKQSTTTPLPPSSAPTPAFEAFSHLNSLHAPPGTPVPGRDSAYLRQTENLFPTPPVSSSFMAEAMFQRQAMSTPFLPPPPPQTGERSSVLTPHIPDSRSSSSSSLLRRTSAMPGSDVFSASQAMQQAMPRNPFTNAWASQDSRPSHWQTPYLPRQSNMAAPGTFFPGKEGYLTGREFMFDPSVRASADGRSMFPSFSGPSQSQDSLPLDRFDLSNYFPNAAAMTPYGSSAAATSLDYTRSAHSASSKPFDERYRQASVGAGATSGTIPDFRSLPAVSGSGTDMFPGIPGVNPGFNLYAAAGNPMSYHHPHAQHPHHHQLTDGSVNSAFLSHHHHHHHHPGSAQHAAMFERDYRGLYPQNAAAAAAAAYPFINDRQYPASSSKLGHSHPSVGPCPSASSADRNLMTRAAPPEGQMQDPYRTMLYRY
ncbi:Zinc finger protein 37 [Plakobranchus ocellatus]|uniref:Zinc finger protein 37 n=1 Tax=Plakobranchus ocellatus TaxID=259542 RepID=A0AAV4BNU7_9GAST|nr:Zinc finger protein 37 [Plakobranchus ocellatus]